MQTSVQRPAKINFFLFVMEDWHNFGADYDKTLMAWNENFEKNWPLLQSKYGDRFYRMWKYYLLSCAGVFRARGIQLWQIVFSKSGVLSGYHSIR
jgi:cyclopropane-fatty-acyl-phospholipid synthase